MSLTNTNDFNAWLGRSEDSEDFLIRKPVQALDAALGYPGWETAPQVLPALRHWLYFHVLTTLENTSEDGHMKRGGFLPPVPLPRRMWAGSDVSFISPIAMNKPLFKRATIKSIQLKQGSSGPLVFVDVEHRVSNISIEAASAEPAVIDLQHIVYREAASAAPAGANLGAASADSSALKATEPAPASDWTEKVTPDEVMLFRYSALTYNGHRIHYDLPYVTGVEGYAGLVTHGPLQATLLLDAALRANPGKVLKTFGFRALAPSFVGETLSSCGKRSSDTDAQIWLLRGGGSVGLKGSVSWQA